MNIYLGADHGGFELKQRVWEWLHTDSRFTVIDCGAASLEPTDDYPPYAVTVATLVAANQDSLGILLCRSGGGMAVVANKVMGIRAVEVFDLKSAVHSKLHDHATIMTLGADWWSFETVKPWIEAFLTTPPGPEERRLRRVAEIAAIEKQQHTL